MRTFTAITLFASLAVTVSAQTSFDREVINISLLQTKEVKDELKVTQAQREKMNVAARAYNVVAEKIEKKIKDGKEISNSERTAMDREYVKMRKGVMDALTAGQLQRLREISLQTVGLLALTAPPVAKRVGLSAAQSEQVLSTFESGEKQVNTIMKAVQERVMKEFKDKKPKNEAEAKALNASYEKRMASEMEKIRPRVEKIQRDSTNKIFSILSAGQRTIWNNLLGKPFNP